MEWRSSDLPSVSTRDRRWAKVIAWADRHPQVWHLLVSRRSKAFGADSTVYPGWSRQNDSPEAVLERAKVFYALVTGDGATERTCPMLAWAARFTFDHFYDRDFESGRIRIHTDSTPEGFFSIDHTSAAIGMVVAQARGYLAQNANFNEVTLDGKATVDDAAVPPKSL